ncbi:MAG: DJ-1/PfpI family protein [Ignavibacteria bacterium]|jgi:DJ-1 family protein|nr:DJ-1/PfpI family protein [Ignavibacteria bacterium]
MAILVPIANGTEEMEAVIIIDMLRRAGLDVVVAGDGDMVTCSRGIRIVPDISIDDISDDDVFDAIILPGGSQGAANFASNTALEHIVIRHKKKKALIGAICAAPTVLHEFGLLRSSTVITSHPSYADVLSGYAYTTDRVAADGEIITSRGAGTAFEFALSLIRKLADEATARRVATDIVLYE